MTAAVTAGPLPLTAAQEGIRAGQLLDPASPAFWCGEYVEISGPPDTALLAEAVRTAVAEAEAVHVRIVAGPAQAVGTSQEIDTVAEPRRIDVEAEPDPMAAALAWMRADLRTPVALDTGPLVAHALITGVPGRVLWFLRIHHLVADGYAFSLLARRAAAVYRALRTGQPPGAGFGPLAGVVAADAAYRTSEQYGRDREFWTARLGDHPDPAALAPVAPAAPESLRTTGELPDPRRLRTAAARLGVAWPDLLLAATAAHLRRRTGGEVVLGLPVSGRLGTPAARVPCMTMNIVALRLPVAPGTTMGDLATAAAAEVAATRPHHRYRYEQLRRDLRLVGGGRRLHGPVVNVLPFDTAVTFDDVCRGEVHHLAAGPVEDLSVTVAVHGAGLRLHLDANPASYSPSDLAGHRDGILAALAELVDDPDRPVTPPSALLDGGPLPAPARDVLALIEEQAATRPGAVALVDGDSALTYAALLARVRDRAVELRTGPGGLVGIALPRGAEAVVTVLATLLAGAAYVPLDPDGPPERTALVEADTDPSVLMHPDLRIEHRAIPDGPIPDGPIPDSLAYVIHTSGSTGRPHGVAVGRAALAHFVAGAGARYGIHAGDRVLQFAPLHFDASVEELFLTLCAGATLVLRTPEMAESVPALLAGCATAGITVLDLPTALWHEVAYAVSTGVVALPDTIRLVVIGGEAALPERVARWHAAVPASVELLNTYGPTEATVVATVATLRPPDPRDTDPRDTDPRDTDPRGTDPRGTDPGDTDVPGGPGDPKGVPIGLPLPGVRAAVVDGELLLLGGGLAEGYLHDPALTATRFVRLGGERAYRTGDRVVLRRDGQLVHAGRLDDQVKISGHRADPAEIEGVLLRHPDVREAAVHPEIRDGITVRLVAHVVPVAGTAVDAARLREHALAALPAAVVPAIFVPARRLPRTSSGKIDRRALRVPVTATVPDDGGSPLERIVRAVFRAVLGADGVAAGDDFFALGGQSLQAIQVANRLTVELGREVRSATVFRHPTAAALAEVLAATAAAVPRPTPGAVPPVVARGGASSGAAAITPLADAVLADAVLGPDVVPPGLQAAAPSDPRRVLLTGATSFVGARLLAELLTATAAEIVCLVGAGTTVADLAAALTAQDLPAHAVPARVIALQADPGAPGLGLGADSLRLVAECDAIYHAGTSPSMLRTYAGLRATNVLGTRELLRIAATGRPTPVHYVSTLAVGPPDGPVPERVTGPHCGLRDGYRQSRWVVEQLVAQAGARGLPVTIHRPGRVLGSADTGAPHAADLLWQMLRAGLPVGALPEFVAAEMWTPADHLARAVVRLRAPGVFNHAPAAPVHAQDLLDWLQDYGYPVEQMPVARWLERLRGRDGDPERAVTAFFDLHDGVPLPSGPVDTADTARSLDAAGVGPPLAGRALLHRLLDHAVRTGLLPHPPLRTS